MPTVHSPALFVYADPSLDAVADRLAWLHDGGDLDDYPGPGWADADPESDPSDDDLAAIHAADHDTQSDPFAIECWTLLNNEYYEAEATLHEVDPDIEIEWSERARVFGHRAYRMAEGGVR